MKTLKIALESTSIAKYPDHDLPTALQRAFDNRALQHQVDVYRAAVNHDIIADLAPTGTGKTKAGLSVLLHNPQRNAVYIAPTNALIEQQTVAAATFVARAGLPHVVKSASARHVRLWPSDRVGKRPGEKIYNVLREPATLFPECGGGRPILLVTNPDIFYYAAFFQYGSLDRSNIASAFYSSFATVIFDEFHLYNAKQLVSLLFYLALSKIFHYFEAGRKIVLLTATPEPGCESALKKLEHAGVKIAQIDGRTQQGLTIPSQTEVELQIAPYPGKDSLIQTIVQEVERRIQEFPDRSGAVILDSKDTLNRIATMLRDRGFSECCGRITGDTPQADRQVAAQRQVILATSTVDVGFNFEREVERDRQNLDWLIFSARDRASFWQRLGRVGRVLGKARTDVQSEAIAYLPERAWEQGIEQFDCSGGRQALETMLASLDCLEKPFLYTYWHSEAFLEIARPLLEIEDALQDLPELGLVSDLYDTLRNVLGGGREWDFYRKRMKTLLGAENIARATISEIQKKWKYIKGGQSYVKSFLIMHYDYGSEDLQEAINSGQIQISEIEQLIQDDCDLAVDIRQSARIFRASYAPLFSFRDSLFENVRIEDPEGLILDNAEATELDPIHLLRFYEFVAEGDRIIVTERAQQAYSLHFKLQIEDLTEFKCQRLCKLFAFENCKIIRETSGSFRPTPLITAIEKSLIPGVIFQENRQNRWIVYQLKQQGLSSYPIAVSDCGGKKADYTFMTGLSGILAIASAGVRLRCPDNESFYF